MNVWSENIFSDNENSDYEIIESGNGYWLRSSGNGEIFLSDN